MIFQYKWLSVWNVQQRSIPFISVMDIVVSHAVQKGSDTEEIFGLLTRGIRAEGSKIKILQVTASQTTKHSRQEARKLQV